MIVHQLSQQQARKLIVLSNDFHHGRKLKSWQATLNSIEHLAYVQIDTISVVNRAHLHVLWSRNHHFKSEHLDQLFAQKDMFEYWSHAAAFLPIKDYRFSLIRKRQIAAGEKHWRTREPKMMREIKAVIKAEGPKKSADFKHKHSSKSQWWDWKPAKVALEQLFMEGELMVVKREGFQKVYDLTQRVLPSTIDSTVPNQKQLCHHLIVTYLQAQGLGNVENFAYLRKGLKPLMKVCVEQMLENNELCQISINDKTYYALPDGLSLLDKRLSRQVHILSPFDNLVIQRKRLVDIFDYDYQIECYVPANKRRFGYFCLPILYGDQLVGRIDCKAHRKQRVFEVKNLYNERPLKDVHRYHELLRHAIGEFAAFNQCDEVILPEYHQCY